MALSQRGMFFICVVMRVWVSAALLTSLLFSFLDKPKCVVLHPLWGTYVRCFTTAGFSCTAVILGRTAYSTCSTSALFRQAWWPWHRRDSHPSWNSRFLQPWTFCYVFLCCLQRGPFLRPPWRLMFLLFFFFFIYVLMFFCSRETYLSFWSTMLYLNITLLLMIFGPVVFYFLLYQLLLCYFMSCSLFFRRFWELWGWCRPYIKPGFVINVFVLSCIFFWALSHLFFFFLYLYYSGKGLASCISLLCHRYY